VTFRCCVPLPQDWEHCNFTWHRFITRDYSDNVGLLLKSIIRITAYSL